MQSRAGWLVNARCSHAKWRADAALSLGRAQLPHAADLVPLMTALLADAPEEEEGAAA